MQIAWQMQQLLQRVDRANGKPGRVLAAEAIFDFLIGEGRVLLDRPSFRTVTWNKLSELVHEPLFAPQAQAYAQQLFPGLNLEIPTRAMEGLNLNAPL